MERVTDTPEPIRDRYRAMLLRLSPAERLAMACRMFDTAKALALAGIRRREPAVVADSPAARQKIFLHLYRNDFSPRETERILNLLKDADQ